jgi:uncharacterized protein YciI
VNHIARDHCPSYVGFADVRDRVDLQSCPDANRQGDAGDVKFLKKYYAAGHFLISGRKIPRDGGIIIATAESRDAIAAIVAEDPFVARGLAEVRIIEFRVSQRADGWSLT